MSVGSYPTGPFVRACCMFMLRDETTRYPVKVEPPTFPFGMDFKVLLVHCFPDPGSNARIYAFTIEKYMCYVFVWRCEERSYSYIVVSDQPTPMLYFEFLEDVQAVLEEGISVTPEILMDMIMSTLSVWKYEDDGIVAQFLQARRFVPKSSYTPLHPFEYMSNRVDFIGLWRNFLLGERILIVGDPEHPDILSKAFFGVKALSPHIPYIEKVVLMPSSEDERNMENLEQYKIVATTSRYQLEHYKDTFKVVVELRTDSAPENSIIEEDIGMRNLRLYNILLFLIERKMLEDPYNELLKKPIAGSELNTEMSNRVMNFTMSADQLIKLANAKSVSAWREESSLSNDFRDRFLSSSAERILSRKSDDELQLCAKILDEIAPKFQTDEHMTAVINSHRRFITRRLTQTPCL